MRVSDHVARVPRSSARSARAAWITLGVVLVCAGPAWGQLGPVVINPPQPAQREPAPPIAPIPVKPAEAVRPPERVPASPPAVTLNAPEHAPPQRPPDDRPETEVLLKDGRSLTGTLVGQDDDSITLVISSIPTRLERGEIERLQTLPSVEERYARIKAATDPRDVEGLVRLSEWLRARERFDLAIKELDAVLAADPSNNEAREARTLALQQKLLKDKKAKSRPATDAPPAPSPSPAHAARAEFPLLTPEQVNLMRVYEMDLKNPPRMTIPREAVTRLLDAYAGREGIPVSPEGRQAFARKPPAEIVEAMFKLRARELYPEIKVADNPRSLKLFRDQVHRVWLLNSCATTQCHGGEHAGRLLLASQRAASDQVVFTNLLILERFRLRDGSPLINYSQPDRSPLLQMGLPENQSLVKHPAVVGAGRGKWRAVFSSPEDARFRDALEWLSAMYKPRPEYPIDYRPPSPSGVETEAADPPPR